MSGCSGGAGGDGGTGSGGFGLGLEEPSSPSIFVRIAFPSETTLDAPVLGWNAFIALPV
jgi:hypothetical protein